MASIYIHLSGEDIDEAQAIMNGVENVKEERENSWSRFFALGAVTTIHQLLNFVINVDWF